MAMLKCFFFLPFVLGIVLTGCKGEPTVLLEETTVVLQNGYVSYTLSLEEGAEVETEVKVQNDQAIDVYTCCSTTGVKSKTYTFTAPKTGEFAVILNNGWRTFDGSQPSEEDADVYVKMTAK